LESPLPLSDCARQGLYPLPARFRDYPLIRSLTLAFVLFVAAPAYGQSYIDELAKQLPAPFRPGINKTFLGKEWRGGNLEKHKEYFKAIAASGEDVEVRDASRHHTSAIFAALMRGEFGGLSVAPGAGMFSCAACARA
jgi:hypothetical protein